MTGKVLYEKYHEYSGENRTPVPQWDKLTLSQRYVWRRLSNWVGKQKANDKVPLKRPKK